MFCTKCGAKNKENTKFCVKCGHENKTKSVQKNTVSNKQFSKEEKNTAKMSTFKKILKKAVGVIILLIFVIMLINLSGLGYEWYEDLPREINELADIQLGMKPVDVTLTKGKPSGEIVGDDGRLRYIYTDFLQSPELFIKFANTSGDLGVVTVCSYEYQDEVFGLGKYDSLEKVQSKLGEPTGKSVNSDGTHQLLTYSKYNVGFMISENEVVETCVTSESKIIFIEEYK